MKKSLIASVAMLGIAASLLSQGALAATANEAQQPSVAQIQQIQQQQSVLLDGHLAGMKAGLNLTADQATKWPAFEAAIRDSAKARSDRWLQAKERMGALSPPNALERMSIMADHLDKGATELRAVVDAGKPLYDSLSDAQKHDFGPLMRQFKPKKNL